MRKPIGSPDIRIEVRDAVMVGEVRELIDRGMKSGTLTATDVQISYPVYDPREHPVSWWRRLCRFIRAHEPRPPVW